MRIKEISVCILLLIFGMVMSTAVFAQDEAKEETIEVIIDKESKEEVTSDETEMITTDRKDKKSKLKKYKKTKI